MSFKIKYISALTMILLISCFSCKENGKENVSAKNETTSVKWGKISEGMKNAELQNKPVLIFFYTEWCVYCRKMTSEVFDNPEIAQYMNENFINLKVNPETDHDEFEIMGEKISPAKLMAYSGAKGFPTTLFLNSKRKPVTTLPGFIEKNMFLPILKFLKEECYLNKVTLDNYIKNPDLCRAKKSGAATEN